MRNNNKKNKNNKYWTTEYIYTHQRKHNILYVLTYFSSSTTLNFNFCNGGCRLRKALYSQKIQII